MTIASLARDLQSLRQAYARDGVVCLRGMFDLQQIAALQRASRDVIDHPLQHGDAGYMQGPMTAVNFLYRRPSVFRDFVFGSPAGEIVGRIIGSSTIRMYHDYVFSKQPGCEKVVPWHTDGGGYALSGEMMPGLWVALTPADETNGRLEFIAGFYREFAAKRWSERKKVEGAGSIEQHLPDFDAPQDPGAKAFQRLTWNLEPGDAVLFHPYTPHHSKPNTSATTRTGYVLRVVGDDVRWCLSKSRWLRMPGVDYDGVVDGAPITDDEAFPVMWRDGERAQVA